jgi:hypothetical protein
MRKTSTIAFVSLLATLVVGSPATAILTEIWSPDANPDQFDFEGVAIGTQLNPDLSYTHQGNRGMDVTLVEAGGAGGLAGSQHAHVGEASSSTSGQNDLIRDFTAIASTKYWRFSMAFRSLDAFDNNGNINTQAVTLQLGSPEGFLHERVLWTDLYRRLPNNPTGTPQITPRVGLNGQSIATGPALGPAGDGSTEIANSTDWFQVFIDMDPWDANATEQPYTVTLYNLSQGGVLVDAPTLATTSFRTGTTAGLISQFSRFNIITDTARGIDMDHLSLVMSDDPLGSLTVNASEHYRRILPEPASLAMLVAGGVIALRRARRA